MLATNARLSQPFDLGSIISRAIGSPSGPQMQQQPWATPPIHGDPIEGQALPAAISSPPPMPNAGPVAGPTSPVPMPPTTGAGGNVDYASMLRQALGPRPELHGFRKVASILGPALMAATGNQAGAQAMIAQFHKPGEDYDRSMRDGQLDAIKWHHDDAERRAMANEPRFFSGAQDQVRYDPATGAATRVYDAPRDFQDFAAGQGEPGSPEYMAAAQDYVLRGNGPTAFKYDRDLEALRNASRISLESQRQKDRVGLEGVRQGNRVGLEGVRQGGRMTARGTPSYRDLHPAARGGHAADLPTVASPADAMKLAPGTKFRTADGSIRVRP